MEGGEQMTRQLKLSAVEPVVPAVMITKPA
jgi:hypothetical protein